MVDRRPVLIISHLYEPGVNRIVGLLDAMAVPWRRWNCEDFPLLGTLVATVDDQGDDALIRDADGDALALADARSVWHRRLSAPALPRAWAEKDRAFAANEVAALLEGTLFETTPTFAVNDRAAERRASNKLRQLRIARAVGLAVPETLVTNDRAALAAFRERIGGPIIFKPVSGFSPRGNDFARHDPGRFARWGGAVITDEPAEDDVEIVFAQLLDDEKVAALGALALCPVAFQRFVPKVADIRVTIVGDAIFACRIHSQDRAETRIDFRRMALLADRNDLRHEPFDLPPAIDQALRRLMSRLGLMFGCVDLVEEADGTMTFLEINPSGQWLWVEHYAGLPISERLALLLAEGR